MRTVHLVALALVLGGTVWQVPGRQLLLPWGLTIVSGLGMVALELYKTTHWAFQGKGLAILVKLVLLALLPVGGAAAPYLLVAVTVVAAIGAHMPSRFRHYSVLLGRAVVGPPKLPPV